MGLLKVLNVDTVCIVCIIRWYVDVLICNKCAPRHTHVYIRKISFEWRRRWRRRKQQRQRLAHVSTESNWATRLKLRARELLVIWFRGDFMHWNARIGASHTYLYLVHVRSMCVHRVHHITLHWITLTFRHLQMLICPKINIKTLFSCKYLRFNEPFHPFDYNEKRESGKLSKIKMACTMIGILSCDVTLFCLPIVRLTECWIRRKKNVSHVGIRFGVFLFHWYPVANLMLITNLRTKSIRYYHCVKHPYIMRLIEIFTENDVKIVMTNKLQTLMKSIFFSLALALLTHHRSESVYICSLFVVICWKFMTTVR